MAKRDDTGGGTVAEESFSEVPVAQETEMGINRYLEKNPHGKALDDMLRVIHRGGIKTEAAWTAQVDAIINRRVH